MDFCKNETPVSIIDLYKNETLLSIVDLCKLHTLLSVMDLCKKETLLSMVRLCTTRHCYQWCESFETKSIDSSVSDGVVRNYLH